MTTNKKISLYFIKFGLLLLILAVSFGVLAALVFVFPDTLGKILPFRNLRPLHVSSAVFWILSAAAGSVLYFLDDTTGVQKPYTKLSVIYLWLWIATVLAVLGSFLFSKFGGREYWEFPPVLALPLLLAWIMFAIKVIHSVGAIKGTWPVYLWMWVTGVIFFIITYTEANLWVMPWFRNNIIRDITIQWKSNGSLVGSWNMMIYGTGIYLMCRISGNQDTAFTKKSFFFFFLGVVNLLFNWGHHTYLVPSAPWIKEVSYIISMTEWVIFLNIINSWRKTVSEVIRHKNLLAYKFLIASEIWIFLNLILALLMSVPAINNYTHGTHITVAHAMGTTIGINTMILFASVFYIFSEIHQWTKKELLIIHTGFWVANVPLLIFWLSLIGAGVTKAYYDNLVPAPVFADVMTHVMPYFKLFTIAGLIVMAGLATLAVMVLRVKIRGKQVF